MGCSLSRALDGEVFSDTAAIASVGAGFGMLSLGSLPRGCSRGFAQTSLWEFVFVWRGLELYGHLSILLLCTAYTLNDR